MASSAVQWCKKKGGMVDKTDLVSRISTLGTSGKHAKNCERDFHTLLKSFSNRLGVKISTVSARFYSHATASVEWREVSVIFPDDLANALFSKGHKVWHHCMYGDHTSEEIRDYWVHCRSRCDWFRGSLCHNYPLPEKIIGFSLYGDGIQAYKGSETGQVTVLGWCSDLAFKNSSLTRYFPIAVYPEYAATEFTHDDIMAHVVERGAWHGGPQRDSWLVIWLLHIHVIVPSRRSENFSEMCTGFTTTVPMPFVHPVALWKSLRMGMLAWPLQIFGKMLTMHPPCQTWLSSKKIASRLDLRFFLTTHWTVKNDGLSVFFMFFSTASFGKWCAQVVWYSLWAFP